MTIWPPGCRFEGCRCRAIRREPVYEKFPAAWLVEHAGFQKGYAKGAVGISSRHTLALVNRGGATAAEIVALKDEIQRRVCDEFGIELQTEPVLVGF